MKKPPFKGGFCFLRFPGGTPEDPERSKARTAIPLQRPNQAFAAGFASDSMTSRITRSSSVSV